MSNPAALRAAADYWAATNGAPSRSDWAADPLAWARARAKVHLWSKQAEIITAVRDHPRVAVRSCHTSGKTLTAAVIAAWWIDAHEPGTAMVLSTAPTAVQVKALLWREIGRLHRSADLPGRVNLTEWYVDGELVAFGRKPSEHDESAFQGVHALHVLVILDEACGIGGPLWTAAETIASNRFSRILAVGNPDDPSGAFAACFAPESVWRQIAISAFDTPAFTGEVVPAGMADLLVSPEWVAARAAGWGEDSALYVSKVLGCFPAVGADAWTVIPAAMAARCRFLDLTPDGPHEGGIDVGAGGDETVFAERRGPVLGTVLSFRDPDPMATVGRLAVAIAESGVDRVRVDVTGIGWGIYGRLRELSSFHHPASAAASHAAEVIGVNFGARARNQVKFKNRRAELWWHGRELSRTGGWDLTGADDAVLGELCAPRFVILDSGGKIRIERKDEVIARLGRSPDRADAILLAFDTAPAAEAQVGGVAAFAAAAPLTAGPAGRPSPFGGGAPGGFGRGGGTGIAGPGVRVLR